VYRLLVVAACAGCFTKPPFDPPPIDAPPGDEDDDDVLDGTDNCQSLANTDQHDEDGDAIGDVCDPCPHVFGDGMDGDGDGVGDACDPDPVLAKHRLLFFDPFTSDRSEWQLSPGFVRNGETLRASSGTGTTAHLFVPSGNKRFVTGGTILAAFSGTPHQLSVFFGGNVAQTVYHYCQFHDAGAATGAIAIYRDNMGSYTNLASTTYSTVLPTGAFSMQIDESITAQQIRYEAKLGGVTYAPLMGSTSTAPVLAAGPEFKIYVNNADIGFDYVVVIETMP
jgi:hypothetical protein